MWIRCSLASSVLSPDTADHPSPSTFARRPRSLNLSVHANNLRNVGYRLRYDQQARTRASSRPRFDDPQAGRGIGRRASRTDERRMMAKKGNGEGSIYPHKKNGKKVGGVLTGYTRLKVPSVATCRASRATKYTTSSSRPWVAALRALSSTRGASRLGNISHAG